MQTPYREGAWAAWFLSLFAIQATLSLIGLVVYEVWLNDTDSVNDTIGNILGRGESLIVILATETYVIVEGATMLAERWKQKRYEDGRAEGRAEGHVEGRADERRMWVEWNQRRESAEKEGRTFTEPPPDSRDSAPRA